MILAVCGNFKPEYILNLIKENMEHFDKQGKYNVFIQLKKVKFSKKKE